MKPDKLPLSLVLASMSVPADAPKELNLEDDTPLACPMRKPDAKPDETCEACQ